MKRLLLFCLATLPLGSSIIHAQRGTPKTIINCSALVHVGGSSGSGFFIQDTSDLFFVTARHVVMDNISNNKKGGNTQYRFKAPRIEVKWYPRKAESSNANIMLINVNALKSSGNLIIGQNPEDDFIIMRIATLESKGDYASANYSSHIKRIGPTSRIESYHTLWTAKFEQINIGSEVIMVGYPKSLGLKNIPQYDFNRPLMRKGIIAGKNVNLKNVVLDCPSFGGNSGGPVYMIIDEGISWQFKLVGLVSSFIPLEEAWVNPSYGIKNVEFANSGYSVIIPIEKAMNQIDVIRKHKLP